MVWGLLASNNTVPEYPLRTLPRNIFLSSRSPKHRQVSALKREALELSHPDLSENSLFYLGILVDVLLWRHRALQISPRGGGRSRRIIFCTVSSTCNLPRSLKAAHEAWIPLISLEFGSHTCNSHIHSVVSRLPPVAVLALHLKCSPHSIYTLCGIFA